MRRGIMITLGFLLMTLQFNLWQGQGSLLDVFRLQKTIAAEREGIQKLTARNQMLDADVQLLKTRPDAMEDRARSELGMIKNGETFCLVVELVR